MPYTFGNAAEADLLLIEGLEIQPLPDSLLAADAAGTSENYPQCCSMDHCSDAQALCSCERCSSGPVDEPCTWWSLVGGES